MHKYQFIWDCLDSSCCFIASLISQEVPFNVSKHRECTDWLTLNSHESAQCCIWDDPSSIIRGLEMICLDVLPDAPDILTPCSRSQASHLHKNFISSHFFLGVGPSFVGCYSPSLLDPSGWSGIPRKHFWSEIIILLPVSRSKSQGLAVSQNWDAAITNSH